MRSSPGAIQQAVQALAKRREHRTLLVSLHNQLCAALGHGFVGGVVGGLDLTRVELAPLDDALEAALDARVVSAAKLLHTPFHLRSLATARRVWRRQQGSDNGTVTTTPHATHTGGVDSDGEDADSDGQQVGRSSASGEGGSGTVSAVASGTGWSGLQRRVRVLVGRACRVRRLRASLLWRDWDEARQAVAELEAFLDTEPAFMASAMTLTPSLGRRSSIASGDDGPAVDVPPASSPTCTSSVHGTSPVRAETPLSVLGEDVGTCCLKLAVWIRRLGGCVASAAVIRVVALSWLQLA